MPKFTPAARPQAIILKSLALLLIATMLAPTVAVGESRKTPKRMQLQSAPVSAPPEPFRIGTTDTGPGLFASIKPTFVASLVSFAAETGTKARVAAEIEPREIITNS